MLKLHPYWLKLIVLEDAIPDTGSEMWHQSHPSMNPSSYNNNLPIKMCPWEQLRHIGYESNQLYFIGLRPISRDGTHM